MTNVIYKSGLSDKTITYFVNIQFEKSTLLLQKRTKYHFRDKLNLSKYFQYFIYQQERITILMKPEKKKKK